MAREYPLERTRNIGIMAHIDAGKTTTTERVLYYTGVNYKIGEVHEGAATMDYMVQEQERGITITSAATNCFWTPARGPVRRASATASTSSTRPATSTSPSRSSAACACSTARSRCSTAATASSRRARRSGARPTSTSVPRIAFMNKMDKVGADFLMCVNSMKERLGTNPVPIQWPLGEEDQHRGIIDLIKMKAAVFDEESKGQKFEWVDIPDELKKLAQEWHDKLDRVAAPTSTTRSWRSTSTARPREVTPDDAPPGAPRRDHQLQARARHLRLRLQEQGRADAARRGRQLPAVAASTSPRSRASTRARRTSPRSSARPRTTSPSARSPSRS